MVLVGHVSSLGGDVPHIPDHAISGDDEVIAYPSPASLLVELGERVYIRFSVLGGVGDGVVNDYPVDLSPGSLSIPVEAVSPDFETVIGEFPSEG